MNYVGNTPGSTLLAAKEPIGQISFFHAPPDPTWLALGGQVVGKTAYPDLWTYAQGFLTANQILNPGLYREVDAFTFALPKLDGLFIRGVGSYDVNRVAGALGAFQADANLSHNHIPNDGSAFQSTAGGPAYGSSVVGANTATATSFSGGPEARPGNVALQPCVKALRSTIIPLYDTTLAARVSTLESQMAVIQSQLAANPPIRRLYMGSVAGGVLTQQRSIGGITAVRTANGLYTITLTPPEANVNYSILVGSASLGASDIGAWQNAPQNAQTVNGFTVLFTTWSTSRVTFDPTSFCIAVI